MGIRSAARRQGDEYQDIYGWFRALDLLRSAKKVRQVSIEDPTAHLFDDVTVRPESGAPHPAEFIQVKFHVDQSGAVSFENILTTRSKSGAPLLKKAWDSWRVLRDEHGPVLRLVSTYGWAERDPVAPYVRRGNRLTPDFVRGNISGGAEKARNRWYEELGSPDLDEFMAFLASLAFDCPFPSTEALLDLTALKMENLGLKHEEEDVRRAAVQVYDWLVAGKTDITAADMNEAIERLALRTPESDPDPSVSLWIHTILKTPIGAESDWELDWLDHFEGSEWLRGHRVHDPSVWNDVMLPELLEVKRQILATTDVRLVRVGGKARLSAWFAIGQVFPRVGGWTLEVDQAGHWWRNDVPGATDCEFTATIEDLGGDEGVLAVGVSITGDLGGDMRSFLSASGNPAEKLMLARPLGGLGPTAFRSAADAVALAEFLAAQMRSALGRRPRRVLLFYFGPLSGAAFIGARLNAVAGEVQIYEDLGGAGIEAYAPSFLLKFE